MKVSGNKLYCKVCLDKVAPAESPKIYSDTSVIAATDEKGCPRQVSKPYLKSTLVPRYYGVLIKLGIANYSPKKYFETFQNLINNGHNFDPKP